MFMRLVRHACLPALFALFVLGAGSRAAPAQTEWLDALRQGGHVIIFRHGATYPDQADTDPFNLDNVDKQRQLNDAGRAKARAIGEAFRRLGIPVARVHTSMFNRAVETGKLMAIGEVTPTIDISEGGLIVSPNENQRRAQALRNLTATAPPVGGNVVLVTHRPNILDAFGKDLFDIREGEAALFKPEADGRAKLVARVQADDWAKLAAPAK